MLRSLLSPKPANNARGKRCRRSLSVQNLEERKLRTADIGIVLESPPAIICEVVDQSTPLTNSSSDTDLPVVMNTGGSGHQGGNPFVNNIGNQVVNNQADEGKNDDASEENSGGGDASFGDPIATTVQLPTFAFTTVSTTVSVPDGGTILLGGVKRLSEGRSEQGVPMLNKIPYVNRLFKNVGVGRDTSSMMMMVTPRIIIQEEEE